jgi:hypothetical protein
MARTGRPQLLEEYPKVADDIMTAIRAGNYLHVAAEFAGISKDTLFAWIKRGKRDIRAGRDTVYAKFAAGQEQALAHAEVHSVAAIRAATKENWQAAAWLLERRHPDRWGRHVNIHLEQCTDEQIESALAVLAADGGETAGD